MAKGQLRAERSDSTAILAESSRSFVSVVVKQSFKQSYVEAFGNRRNASQPAQTHAASLRADLWALWRRFPWLDLTWSGVGRPVMQVEDFWPHPALPGRRVYPAPE